LTILEIYQRTCHIGNMTKTPKRPRDVSQLAKMMVDIASGETSGVPENPASASERGKLGGLKGGKARAKNMSPAERSAAAKKAAISRWGR
jgi:hypothetical protein